MPLRGKGAQKALRGMQDTYGAEKGSKVFWAKLNAGTAGKTVSDKKATSFYKRGGTQKPKPKR